MMLYELINMSDKYTFHADSLECAAVLTILLGNGQYGATPLGVTASEGVPIFILGGADEWFTDTFGRNLSATMDLFVNGDHKAELVAALRDVVIGDREQYAQTRHFIAETALGAWQSERHDRLRSSMNNIGERASQWAAKIEGVASKALGEAPQQVFTI